MTEILKETVKNEKGKTWIRTHGTDPEGNAICSMHINDEQEGVELTAGDITCPDCIEFIYKCKRIDQSELAPEYDNELFWKRHDKS